jgi:Zn-dependent M28 family amino/carboxypeptidase
VIRSLATGGDRFAHAGAARYDGTRFPIPAFAVSEPDADQILRLTQLGEKVRLKFTSTASYVPNAMSQNVVADIRGSERPGDVIVLGAHLDSWDQGTGAIDDAAGLAIITGAARLIGQAPRKPKRTVRVVFYGSEEVSQPGAIASSFGSTLVRVLAPIAVVPSNQPPGSGGSDTAPLAQLGVPIFLLNQDGTKYFDIHHTANDTLDKIDPAALSQNVAAWVALAWLAADCYIDLRALTNRGGC